MMKGGVALFIGKGITWFYMDNSMFHESKLLLKSYGLFTKWGKLSCQSSLLPKMARILCLVA